MVKDFFPHYYKVTGGTDADFWMQDLDLGSTKFCEILFDFFETDLERTGTNLDAKIQVAVALITDLIHLKATQSKYRSLLDFIQFLCATTIADFVTNNTLFSLSFDWICNSLSKEISTSKKRETEPERIRAFGKRTDQFSKAYFLDYFFSWVKTIFYYSRCTGGHNELCKYFLANFFDQFIYFSERLPLLETCKALSQVATWCYNHKFPKERKLCDKILHEFALTAEDINVRKLAAFQFSCMKDNYTDKSRYEWALIVKEKYSELLNSLEKMQLQINLNGNDITKLRENFKYFIEAIKEYVSHYSTGFDVIAVHHQNRIFSIFEEPIETLMNHQEVKLLTEMFGAYFQVPDDELKRLDIMYIIPNSINGVIYVCTDGYLANRGDSKVNIPKIVEAENLFLGTRHTLNDSLDFFLDVPDRPGVPNWKYATSYFKELKHHFKIEELKLNPAFANCSGMYLQNGTQMPIQPIIALELGKAIPWVYSFREPLPIGPVKSVFIWEGYTQFAEIERVGLQEIFSKLDIKVDFLISSEATKEDFIREYKKNYDIFWVLGHGEIFSDEMHLSYLDFGGGITVTLEELKTLKYTAHTRRLFIMDTCDSATTGLQNNPVALGLGVSIVNKYQSIVGHSWPVENISSLISGLLLASFLSNSLSYEVSIASTVSMFYNGKDAVLEHLEKYLQNADVLDRIRSTSIDFQNFYYWGSLNYFI